MLTNNSSTSILGVKVDLVTFDEAVSKITEFVNSGGHHQVVTVNPEFVVAARRDPDFKDILNGASLSVPDGVGMMVAGKVLRSPLKDRITGVDLVEELARVGSTLGWSFFFLGGRNNSGKIAANMLKIRYPKLQINGVFEGDGSESGDAETLKAVTNVGKTAILLVAYGHPKQEKWIKRNLAKTEANVAIGVGGAFDYLSNQKTRAPRFMRSLGLEWFYRLVSEPWRLKRQLDLPKFVFLVLKNRF